MSLVHTRPYPNSDHTTLSMYKTAKSEARGDSRHKKRAPWSGALSFLLVGAKSHQHFNCHHPGPGASRCPVPTAYYKNTDTSIVRESQPGGSMQVFTDPSRNQVIIRGEGNEIILSWAQALNLGSLLIKKAEEAEPPARPGKTYRPAIER